LRAYPVPHNDFQVPIPALGLRFEIGTAKQDKPVVVAFSGDTFEHPVLERICQDADLAIMDMAGEPVHLSSEQAASIAAASGVKVLAGTHLMPWDKYGPPSYHREQAEKHFPGRTEMLISGTTMSFDKGQFNKPMWIQTGQPVTEYERKTFERGCEPRLVQYVPRGAEHRASGQLPPDPTAARAAKTTRLAQLSSVIRPRF
ncbi:MAG TPA: hypothetical protein VHU91_06085, partial [Mycobacteriales bacterium]|nr:hypothetical protein [Mycobacteriales bacterium]